MILDSRYRKALVLVAVILYIPAVVSIEGFGTYQVEESKKIDGLEANFTIGVVNLYNDSRRLVLDVEESPDYRVVFPDNPVNITPSEITSSSADGRWISLGAGRYADITQISFKVVLNDSANRRKFSVPLTVATSHEQSVNSSGPIQTAYQVQEHVFKLETTSQLIMPEAEDIYGEGNLWSSNESSEESVVNESRDVNSSNVRNDRANISGKSSEKGLTRDNESSNEGANTWTLMLFVGAVLSVTYLIRQI